MKDQEKRLKQGRTLLVMTQTRCQEADAQLVQAMVNALADLPQIFVEHRQRWHFGGPRPGPADPHIHEFCIDKAGRSTTWATIRHRIKQVLDSTGVYIYYIKWVA